MEVKAPIRKQALQVRDSLTKEERIQKSNLIVQKVMEHRLYRQAEKLLVYVNYKSEVDTLVLIQEAVKEDQMVYCPKVHGKEMEFYRIISLEELVDGYKGIREPVGESERMFTETGSSQEAGTDCLMLMPGSAFDAQRNRIGYGGGYYDKYLEKHPWLHTIAVCFECQIQKNIPADTYDWKPDVVVTECNIYQ